MGCLSRISEESMTNTLTDPNGFLYDFDTGLVGFEATDTSTWSPALDATITAVAEPPTGGTDVLSLRRARGELPVTPPYMPSTSADIHTVPNTILSQFQIVVVADCDASAVLQISNSNPATAGNIAHNTGVGVPGNATKDLGKIFGEDAEILIPVVETLYIAPGASGRPALWRLRNDEALGGDNPQELVEGVEDMQILYGEDTDDNGTVDVFVTADAVAAWNQVLSIRISLLLQTLDDNLATASQQYTYNGAVTTPADRRLRRVFTTTVSLRNRMP
jgi:type IV pilus assembly protein PilW